MGIASTSGFGNESYKTFISTRMAPFSVTRFMPFASTATLILFLSRSSFDALSVFGYLMSVFMVATTILTMPLMVVGNLVARNPNNNGIGIYFYSGILLAFILGVIAAAINYAIVTYYVSFDGMTGFTYAKVIPYVTLYLLSIVVLSINSFLYIYMEALGLQRSVSRSKLISSISTIGFIVIALGVLNPKSPLAYSMGSFILGEGLLLCSLLMFLVFRNCKECLIPPPKSRYLRLLPMHNIMSLGLPVAVGMGGQKAIYYLINDRLLTLDIDYVGMLSVFSSISALVLIPVAAFCQANSLAVSRKPGKCFDNFFYSVAGWVLVIVPTLFIGCVFFPVLVRLFGLNDELAGYDASILLALVVFVVSSGILTFATSALRGMRDTFVPQVAITSVMLMLFIPLIWSNLFDDASFVSIIYSQSLFLFLCGVAMTIRYFQKSMQIYEY
ncbi:hypothetical protein [Halomonas sp. I5-271120]|uniref:hypothetical protein n=1 Tax=Halomonas sp. I5-271120 TaxID=3061632 RepID=UPI0027146B81|nr:hypothetical protein [Halomonas sp. I5-271120]